jgi:transcriptional regulator with XRE-family HTH domain
MTKRLPHVKGKRRVLDQILTPAQCRGARAMLGLQQKDLAERAKVSRPVVVDFENETRRGSPLSLDAIRRALEEAGAVFLDEEGELGRGVRLRAEPDQEVEAPEEGDP